MREDNLKSSGVPRYPKTVILETTNVCNLRCRMCHIWGEGVQRKRDTGFMREALWTGAIDELSAWGEPVTLALHGAGEVLLNKEFLKILSYATARKNISAGFLTNGSLLSQEIARSIMDTDIAWIGFSVDGAEEQKYKNYRGADLKKVESAIEFLLSHRKGNRPSVFLNMVALPDLDTGKFIERWIDKVDEVKISRYRPIGHRDFLTERLERTPCYLLEEMLVVAWDGAVVLCCEDIWAEELIGHFPDQSLFELWHSPRFEKIRKLHKEKNYGAVPICAKCDYWSNNQVKIEMSGRVQVTTCAAQSCYRKIEIPVS